MPFFRFDAQTPYVGEVITEYYEIGNDELESVDEICEQMEYDVAEKYWSSDEDNGCTEEEYATKSSCTATEISKLAYEEESGKFRY